MHSDPSLCLHLFLRLHLKWVPEWDLTNDPGHPVGPINRRGRDESAPTGASPPVGAIPVNLFISMILCCHKVAIYSMLDLLSYTSFFSCQALLAKLYW